MTRQKYDRCQDCGAVYTGGYHLMRCPNCMRLNNNKMSGMAHAARRYGEHRDPVQCPMCGRLTWRDSGFCSGCERKLYKQNAMIESYMGARVSHA